MSWRSPWARLGLVVIIGIGLAAGWASYRQYERSVRIQAEIDVLKREADRVARENETLSEKIQYFASPNFKEEEAKEKLGLRRQEEKVMTIEGKIRFEEEKKSATGSVESDKVAWEVPNYKKWWNRFFATTRR
jgi:cell division protein FtsB